MTISGQPSKTDWDRVRRSIATDEPIPYDANDPDDGPYDPNDDEAVGRILTEAPQGPERGAILAVGSLPGQN
jgi:hypothetical protein